MMRVISVFTFVLLICIGWVITTPSTNIETTVMPDEVVPVTRLGIDVLLMDLSTITYLVSICSFSEFNDQIRDALVYLAETESQNAPKALMVIARVSSALHSMHDQSDTVVIEQIRSTLCTDENRLTIKTMINEIEDHIRWYSDYVL